MSKKIKRYLEEGIQPTIAIHKMDTLFNELLMEAIQDDTTLTDEDERANCPNAGDLGHFHCGWDKEKNLPRSQTEPYIKPKLQPKNWFRKELS